MSIREGEAQAGETAEDLKKALTQTTAAKELLGENAGELLRRRDEVRDEMQGLLASFKDQVDIILGQTIKLGLLATQGSDVEAAIRGNNTEAVEKLDESQQIVATGHIALQDAVGKERASGIIGQADTAALDAFRAARSVDTVHNTMARVRYDDIQSKTPGLEAHLRAALESLSEMNGTAKGLLPSEEAGAPKVRTAYANVQTSETILSSTIEDMRQYRLE